MALLRSGIVSSDTALYSETPIPMSRIVNGTRPITDPGERERYQVQVWGP